MLSGITVAYYRTSKCPYCEHTLERMKPTGVNDYSKSIGCPLAECPTCGRPYLTGKKYWAIMNRGEQRVVVAKLVFTAVYSALALGTVGAALVAGGLAEASAWIGGFELTEWLFLAFYIPVAAIVVLWYVILTPLELRGIKEWEPSPREMALWQAASRDGTLRSGRALSGWHP